MRKRQHYFFFLIGALIIAFSCSPKYITIDTVRTDDEISKELLEVVRSLPPSYDFYNESRTIRTYFHFINSADSSLNYNGYEAHEFVRNLLFSANERLARNDKMNLPVGNETPVLDAKIRFELSEFEGNPGIFFHYNKSPEYFIKNGIASNLYDRKVINKYACDPESVINILVLPFQPNQLKSGDQKLEQTAIALDMAIKLPGPKQIGTPAWTFAAILIHEMGHILGLRHTWNSNDGCDDTPLHSNCWNQSEKPPCDTNYSNNVMDYNAHQSALTPCQIAKMHSEIMTPGKRGYRAAIDNRCEKSDQFEKRLNDYQHWRQPIGSSGNIVIEKGGVLYLRSVLHMAADTEILIKNGGTLILENATIYSSCSEPWKGIKCHPRGNLYFVGDKNVMRDLKQDLHGT